MPHELLKNKAVLIFDYGNFSYVAQTFADPEKGFGRVLYYCPYEAAFVRHNPYIIGIGIPNVERIFNIWDYFDEIDLWYFTDLHQGAFQSWLRSLGKIVFGAGMAEELELYREKAKILQQDFGLPVNPYEVVKGVTELKDFLKDKSDLWIKSDFFRGDNETWHYDNMELAEEVLTGLENDLGANKENEVFIVEEPIEDAVEYGYDGFNVDGRYPENTCFGIEVKDSSYAGVFTEYNKLPKPMKELNEKLSPTFSEYNYRGWYSNEMRATSKNEAILTDLTMRNAEPPTSLVTELFKDFPLYVWQVAYGIVPQVESDYKYGVEIVMKSEWAKTKPQPIYFPEKYSKYVKIKNLYIEDGIHKFIPQDIEMCECGAIVGLGKTLKEAIEMAQTIAKEVKGYCLKINCDSLDEAQEEINELNSFGVKIF